MSRKKSSAEKNVVVGKQSNGYYTRESKSDKLFYSYIQGDKSKRDSFIESVKYDIARAKSYRAKRS